MKALGLKGSAGTATGNSCTSFQPAALGGQAPTPVWSPRLLQPQLRPGHGALRASRRAEASAQRRTLLGAGTAALLTAVPHEPVAPAVAAPEQLAVSESVRLDVSNSGSASNGDELGPAECAKDCRPANPPLRITAPGRVVAGQEHTYRKLLESSTYCRARRTPQLGYGLGEGARKVGLGRTPAAHCLLSLAPHAPANEELSLHAEVLVLCIVVVTPTYRSASSAACASVVGDSNFKHVQLATSTGTCRRPSACSSWRAAWRRWTADWCGQAATPLSCSWAMSSTAAARR
jgi:hypothetical protein